MDHTDITKIIARHARGDGHLPTDIDFLSTIRRGDRSPLSHGVLEPSFCLVLQGSKRMLLGNDTYDYGAGSFVCSVIDLPTAGQITKATAKEPYLALRIGLDPREVAAVALEAKIPPPPAARAKGGAAFVGDADPVLLEAILRLVRLLDAPRDAAFLAAGVKREIVYRLLTGPYGARIAHNVLSGRGDGVGRALLWLRKNFAEPLKIDELARTANMSVSSLHHKFKAATAMGPLQYQKHLRLQEARRLILAGETDAGTAAFQVGYESQSQFTREYRRLFGAPPLQDIKTMKGIPSDETY